MLTNTRQLYDQHFKNRLGDAKGATIDDIAQLSKSLGMGIPLSLRAFLLWGGKHFDGPFIGSDCFAPDITSNTHYLNEFLAENKLSNPKGKDYIVFYNHQGYALAWVYASDGDNPEVYYFVEGTMQDIAKEQSIDAWFYKILMRLHTSHTVQEPASARINQ